MENANAYSFNRFKADYDSNSKLIENLDKPLTPSYYEILKNLYDTPNLTPKKLSARLGKSPNSLSNMLARINEITPPLIESEKIGREKQLRLSEVGKAYIKSQEASSDKQTKVLKFSDSLRDEAFKNAMHALDDFKKYDPDDWFIKLDDYLTGHPTTEDASLNNSYNKFMSNIRLLRVNGYHMTLRDIFDSLEDRTLTKRIQNNLDQSLDHFYQLETLFSLANAQPQSAFEIIDDMFLRIFPETLGPLPDISSRPHKKLFPEAIFATAFCQISNMAHTALLKHWDKNHAIESWEQMFCTKNIIFYYAAEKCQTVQTIQTILQKKGIL